MAYWSFLLDVWSSYQTYLYCFLQLARSFRNAAAILEAEAQSELDVGFSSTSPQIPVDTSATAPLQPSAAGSQDEPWD